MTTVNPLRLAFYGDDFTGSTDALEFLTRAGARTALFIEPPTPARLARYPALQAIGVAGMTRSLGPEAMEAELRPALSALRALGAPHVHYKVCSTFDSSPTIGSIGRAIDVAVEIFKARFVPLLVGAPALGRYCVFGNLFARMGIGSDGAIHRLDRHPGMSRHPVTPAHESDLRRHLAKQTKKRIGLVDILQLALPETEARKALEGVLAGGAEIVLFDVLYPEQLARLGGLIDPYASRERPLFSVGSSGVEMALGAHWAARGRLSPAGRWGDPGPAEPLLVTSGSCSPVTAHQIAWALAHNFEEVALDPVVLAKAGDSLEALRPSMAATIAHLQAGRSVIVHTSRGKVDSGMTDWQDRSAQILGLALGRVIRAAIEHTGVKRAVIAGGDTSSYVARALGIEAVEMMAPLTPGAPLCRAHAPASPVDGLEVNFKGGQVGGEDYFGRVARGGF